MILDFRSMVMTCGQIWTSAAISCADAVNHAAWHTLDAGEAILAGAVDVARAPAPERQAAMEAAVGTVYREYLHTIRTMAGLPRRSALVYLNELDAIRGPRRQPSVDASGKV